MNLTHLFDLSFVGRREELGVEFEGTDLTFGEVDQRSNRMANLLLKRGLSRGDRLCVYLPNSLDLIDLYLACIKSGIIFVPINILYRQREIDPIVRDAEPKLMVTEAELGEWREASATMNSERPEAHLEGHTPAAIVYTSGTTGASKGAILSHDNFAANALNLLTCWQITNADRFLLALPLFHVHALGNGLHCWLIGGCRMRLLPRFEHEKAAAIFLEFRPSLFFGVPTMYVRLLEISKEVAREMGGFMRLFVSGSAPLPAQVLEQFRERFGHTILERYGMTETLMTISNPYHGERRPGTVGFPLPGTTVKLQEGELYVRGPTVFAGYWKRDDATRAAFADGFFRTGDLATRSDDGYITLQGRRSDLIISGGFNIYPREIEEFLLEQEGVLEAAVVGIPHQLRGEVPVAYVVSRGELDSESLSARCRESLASFKVPREFIRIDKLPRNALGKIQKHLLPRPVGSNGGSFTGKSEP